MITRVVVEGHNRTHLADMVENAARMASLSVYRIYGDEEPSEKRIATCDVFIHELPL